VSVIDLDRLAAEISPEAPSGEQDLEYDPAFMALEESIKGAPEIEMDGKIVQEAKEPNWREIQESAVELFTRTHDLRIAVSLASALLHTDGLIGFRDGLDLIRRLVARHWDTLYPRLDPDLAVDPIRVNVLMALNDPEIMILPLMRATLCASRAMGRFSLRDIYIANGKISPGKKDKQPAPDSSLIEAAFKDCDAETLKETKEAIAESLQIASALETDLMEKMDSGSAPHFEDLKRLLKDMEAFLEKKIEGRLPSEPSAPIEKQETPSAEGAGALKPAGPLPPPETNTMETINGRQDVIRILDRICAYYEQSEPASPVPLLLKRARGLVEKNFFEIVQDLAPESAAQIQKLFGEPANDGS